MMVLNPVDNLLIVTKSGKADMNINGVWERRGVTVSDPKEYHL